jgi:hypothetical protein
MDIVVKYLFWCLTPLAEKISKMQEKSARKKRCEVGWFLEN